MPASHQGSYIKATENYTWPNQVEKVRYGWYMGQYTAPNPCMPSQPTIFPSISSGQQELPGQGVMADYFHWNQVFCSPFISHGWRLGGVGWLVINTVKDGVWRTSQHGFCWFVYGQVYAEPQFLYQAAWRDRCWTSLQIINRIDLKKSWHSHAFLKGFRGNKNPWTHELLLVVFVFHRYWLVWWNLQSQTSWWLFGSGGDTSLGN